MEQKVCECGNKFVPCIVGQCRCVDCIMEKEPKKPSKKADAKSREFAEWFIWHWRNIRMAADEFRGK